jgi:hypothetical protein
MSLEAKERGPEVSYQLALLITGVALAYWVDLGFVQGLDRHPWLWRIPLALQSCFAIFSAVLLFMLPDTPRWYYARGHIDKGDKVLARLHNLPVEHNAVQLVRKEIIHSLQEEADEETLNWTCLFWDNTELQFGRRLRTSFLINWVSTWSVDRNTLLIIIIGRHNNSSASICLYTSVLLSSRIYTIQQRCPEYLLVSSTQSLL